MIVKFFRLFILRSFTSSGIPLHKIRHTFPQNFSDILIKRFFSVVSLSGVVQALNLKSNSGNFRGFAIGVYLH